MFDPGEWIPLIGVVMMVGTTVVGIGGAWALGRARGWQDAARSLSNEAELRARLERMERSVEAVAHEMERIGEIQRFALKVIDERSLAPAPEAAKPLPRRVITPH